MVFRALSWGQGLPSLSCLHHASAQVMLTGRAVQGWKGCVVENELSSTGVSTKSWMRNVVNITKAFPSSENQMVVLRCDCPSASPGEHIQSRFWFQIGLGATGLTRPWGLMRESQARVGRLFLSYLHSFPTLGLWGVCKEGESFCLTSE